MSDCICDYFALGENKARHNALIPLPTSVVGRWFFNCSSMVASLSVQKIE
jgi:hypothetical protein